MGSVFQRRFQPFADFENNLRRVPDHVLHPLPLGRRSSGICRQAEGRRLSGLSLESCNLLVALVLGNQHC
jgi:hypothetical protein